MSPGTYFVAVQSGGLTQNTLYTIEVRILEWDDSDNPIGELESGQEVTGNVTLGDIDAYRFEANSGDQLLFNAGYLGNSGGISPHIQLFTVDGDLLAEDDSSRSWSAFVEWKAVLTGSYILVARERGDNSSGNYRLGMLRLPADVVTNDGDQGGLLLSGEERSGSLGYGDLDTFWFDAAVGDQLMLNAGWIGGSMRPHIQLYAPDGALLVEDDSTGSYSAFIEWEAHIDGRYTFVIRERGDDHTGEYRLGLLNLPGEVVTNDGDEGGLLVDGQEVDGTLGYGDLDVFWFEGAPGNTVSITAGGGIYPHVQLFGPDGGLIGEDGSEGNASGASLEVTLTTGGQHHVVIRERGDDSSGNYQMTFEVN